MRVKGLSIVVRGLRMAAEPTSSSARRGAGAQPGHVHGHQ